VINDLAELKKLLKLCRQQGVTEITLSGTVIKFGDLPAKKAGEDDAQDDAPDLPDEQMIFFSARPPEGSQQ
jgi:hypothetical protein